MPNTIIKIADLPLDIQQKLPLSIRTLKPEYELDELPPREREILKKYLNQIPDVVYDKVYDIKPEISQYADFVTISKNSERLLEYVKNFLYTLPGDYPFDPYFGSQLKLHLQTKDTNLRRTLVQEEIFNVVDAINSDLNVDIKIKEVNIYPYTGTTNAEYFCSILVEIDNEGPFTINYQAINS